MTFAEKQFGYAKPVYCWKVAFYDGGEKEYRQGASAYKYAGKCAREGRWCALYGLTNEGWVEFCCC